MLGWKVPWDLLMRVGWKSIKKNWVKCKCLLYYKYYHLYYYNCTCENEAFIYMCVYIHILFFFLIRDTTFIFSQVFKLLVVIISFNNEKTLKNTSLGQSQSGYQDVGIFLKFFCGKYWKKEKSGLQHFLAFRLFRES